MSPRNLSASRPFVSPLNALRRGLLNGAQSAGTDLSVGLSLNQCAYLLWRIAEDLGKRHLLPEAGPALVADFFAASDPAALEVPGYDTPGLENLFAALLALVPDADTYFHCLADLHKRRLKYTRILQYQPLPTMMQVGPRGLLQYGSLPDTALGALLFWRKWFFDIDNRAGQETGYVFEPIVVRCIGGLPAAAKNSPVRRRSDPTKGRQVDCVLRERAYEIKLRVTIAASGQGRWGEEREFPADCVASGFVPVLLVFDDTQANKLDELRGVFEAAGGEVYVGAAAWAHLEQLAGETIAVFVEKYVRQPLANLLAAAPGRTQLPELNLRQTSNSIVITVGGEELTIVRPQAIAGFVLVNDSLSGAQEDAAAYTATQLGLFSGSDS